MIAEFLGDDDPVEKRLTICVAMYGQTAHAAGHRRVEKLHCRRSLTGRD
ncbi:hypothetical protein [Streptomyces sp. NRRL S-1022]|nr:hypothetical protein [Streptomyces sp. NRRL S-1022]